ncbi:MAG: TolC family protein [Bacteroidetes bacterium]|nr:TolC family protein [Bacteroidota bacterium]
MICSKPLFFLLGLLCALNTSSAQTIDYDKIVIPLDTKARDFSEYLVQLAWQNNPEAGIVNGEKGTAVVQAQIAQKEWMRDVQGNFNLNEANLRKAGDSNNNFFFPRYNFGLTLNLYDVMSQGGKNKLGKKKVEVADYKVKQQKIALREETLTRYANFRLAKAILEKRALAEQEIYTAYLLVQQLYKTDEKTLDDYTRASSMYYQAQEMRLKAENEVLVAKFALEAIIGIKWEEVQHPEKKD